MSRALIILLAPRRQPERGTPKSAIPVILEIDSLHYRADWASYGHDLLSGGIDRVLLRLATSLHAAYLDFIPRTSFTKHF